MAEKLKEGKKEVRFIDYLKAYFSVKYVRFLLNRSDGKYSDDLLENIRKKEDKLYKAFLKEQYVKKILPRTYKKHSKHPLENKVLFMMPRHGGLNENFKYLHEKLIKESDYDVRYVSLEHGSVPLSVFYHNAEQFTKDFATAKALFMHVGIYIFAYMDIRKETKLIQLWHGCGAFKKFGFSRLDSFGAKEDYPPFSKFTTVTIASPELSWVYEEAMGIDKNSGVINPIGVARTDLLFDIDYIADCYKRLYKAIPAAKNKKIILYAPTFRGNDLNKATAPNKLKIEKFGQAFSDEYVLIVKHHNIVKKLPEIPDKYCNSFAYDMTRSKTLSITDLLIVSDICISDYSSLVFEFALFERPIVFFNFDSEKYINTRGLYYNYEEITPGPKCKTNKEIIEYIKNIETRFNKHEVTAFKNKFMSSCDGHASERIIKLIEEE